MRLPVFGNVASDVHDRILWYGTFLSGETDSPHRYRTRSDPAQDNVLGCKGIRLLPLHSDDHKLL